MNKKHVKFNVKFYPQNSLKKCARDCIFKDMFELSLLLAKINNPNKLQTICILVMNIFNLFLISTSYIITYSSKTAKIETNVF